MWRKAAIEGIKADPAWQGGNAVLFYGSCLREKQLDGLMLDFYLIVSDYRAAYDKRWLARGQPADPAQRLLFRA
jgi:hypothetical protein